jgi:hypothetical protein
MADIKLIGAGGLVCAVLGYKMMVRIGDAIRHNSIANLSYEKGYTGCGLKWLALMMMLGGVGAFIYGCMQYAKTPN